jgi:hypothetical protein
MIYTNVFVVDLKLHAKQHLTDILYIFGLYELSVHMSVC